MSPALAILCNAAAPVFQSGVGFEVAIAAAQSQPPEWVQITPRGAVVARDGRAFSFDPERLAAVFAAEGLKLPIDFEHEAEHISSLGAKPARGWIVALEARTAGLFGRIEWLADAVTALAAKHYRYISPTFFIDDRGHAARLKGAALVASPALGMPAVASSQQQGTTMDKAIAAALGLAETANASDAVVAIETLKTTPDATKFVAKAVHDEALTALAAANARIKSIDDATFATKCAALVDDAVKGGKIAPALRAHYLGLATASFDDTKKLVDAMPVIVAGGADPTKLGADGGKPDAVTLAAKARAYMDKQAAKGIVVTATDAVTHVSKGA